MISCENFDKVRLAVIELMSNSDTFIENLSISFDNDDDEEPWTVRYTENDNFSSADIEGMPEDEDDD